MERRGREGGVRHIEKDGGEEGGRGLERGEGPRGDGTQGQVAGERERERLENIAPRNKQLDSAQHEPV